MKQLRISSFLLLVVFLMLLIGIPSKAVNELREDTHIIDQNLLLGNGGNLITISENGGDLQIDSNVIFNNQIEVRGGSPGNGKVLTSDANGLASWIMPSVVSSEWTDTGTVIHPSEPTVDEVAVGGTTEAGADIFLGVDGFSVFNEQGNNVDFRVESNTDENAFIVDGSADNVGVGFATPAAKLAVNGAGLFAGNLNPSVDNGFDLGTNSERWRDLFLGPNSLHIGSSSNEAVIRYDTANNELEFDPDDDGTAELIVTDAGAVTAATSFTAPTITATTSFNAASFRATNDGTTAAPAYSFTSGTNMGMRKVDGSTLGLVVGGTDRFTVSNATVTVLNAFATQGTTTLGGDLFTDFELFSGNGSAATPSLSFRNAQNLGLYFAAANTMGFSAGGAERMTLSNTAFDINVPVTVDNSLTVNNNFIPNGVVLVGVDGTAAAPAYSFESSTNMGVRKIDGSTLGVVVGGTDRLTVSNAAVTVTNAFVTQGTTTLGGDLFTDFELFSGNGSAATPSLSFRNAQNLGLYFAAPNTMGFSAGGTERMTLSNAAFDINVPVTVDNSLTVNNNFIPNGVVLVGVDGTTAAPAYSFESSTNMGVRKIDGSTLGVVVGGTDRFTVSNAAVTVTNAFATQGTTTLGGDLFTDFELYAGNGSAATPSLSFRNSQNLGLYFAAANTMGFSAGGAERMTMSNAALTVNLPANISGNLGVGFVSPNNKLAVNGQILISGGSPGLDKVLRSDASGLATWVDANTLPGVGGEWTDTGAIVHPTESTVDEVAIGGTTEAGADIFLGVDGTAVFNEQSNSVDFRVESNTDENALVVDGSADNVGVGFATPGAKLAVNGGGLYAGSILPTVNKSFSLGSNLFRWEDAFLNGGSLHVGNATNDEGIIGYNGGTLIINSMDGGSVSINEDGLDTDFIVKNSAGGNVVSVDAGANGNIAITPDGIGSVVLDGLNYPQADGTNGQALVTDGSGNLSFATIGGGSSEWTDTGAIIHPSEPTVDEVAIGGTTEVGADIFLGVDGSSVFNEQGNSVDFRVESNTDENAFIVDGSANNVGIGISTPAAKLEVNGAAIFAGNVIPSIDNGFDLGSNSFRWQDLFLGPNSLHIGTSGNEAIISYDTVNNRINIDPDGDNTAEVTISDAGEITAPTLTSTVSFNAASFRSTSDGAANSPAFSFVSDTDLGMRRNAANDMRFSAGGVDQFQIQIGTSRALTNFDVDGTSTFGSSAQASISNTGQMRAGNGAANGPGLSFNSDPDLGIFRAGSNDMGFSAGGVNQFQVQIGTSRALTNFDVDGTSTFGALAQGSISNAGHIRGADGAANAPGLSFNSDTDLGMFRVSSNQLGISAGGVQQLRVQAGTVGVLTSFDVDGSSTFGTSGSISNTGQMRGADGAANSPGLSFNADTDLGMFRIGNDNMGFSSGGVQRMNLNNLGLSIANNLTVAGTTTLNGSFVPNDFIRVGINGAANGPAFSFSADTNLGMYRVGNDHLRFSAGGVDQFRIQVGTVGVFTNFDVDGSSTFGTSGSISNTGQMRGADGAANSPGLSFHTDTDLGMFRIGNDNMGFSSGGVQRMNLNNTGLTIANNLTVTGTTTLNGSFVPNSFIRAGIDGAANSPVFSFSTDTDLGMYRVTNDHLRFSAGGVDQFRIQTGTVGVLTSFDVDGTSTFGAAAQASISNTGLMRAGAGAANSPGLSFNSDIDSGIFSGGADDIRISTGGVQRMRINNINVTVNDALTVEEAITARDIDPNTTNTHDFGSNTLRWRDLFLGPNTLHIGTSTTDEGTIAYSTSNNILQIASITGGQVAINDGSLNTDFRVEGNTDTNLLRTDAGTDNVGIGFSVPAAKLAINGQVLIAGGSPGVDKVLRSSATGLATWVDLSAIPGGTSEWTMTGNIIHPDVSATEEVAIGGTTEAGADIFLGADGASVFNEQGNAVDLRVEGDGDSNLLVVDGSADRVGVGTASPEGKLNIISEESTTQTVFTQGLANGGVIISSTFTDESFTPGVFWSTTDDNPTIPKAGIYLKQGVGTGTSMYFGTSGLFASGITNDALVINSSANIGINTDTPSAVLNVEELDDSATQTNFTQDVSNAGILITSNFVNGNFTPGVFWNTDNDNPSNPKAGIYTQNTGGGSFMYLGVSDNFSTGITNDGIVIDPAGEVGIGTNNPIARLHVIENGGTGLIVDRLSSDGILVSLRQDGVEEGTISVAGNTVSYNAFTGSHYAWFEKENIKPGMLVSMTGNNQYRNDDENSEIIYGITKTQIANDKKVLGAFLGAQETSIPVSSSNPYLVMATGNGFMWIVDNGEDVEIGDPLISSSLLGYAMKDTGGYSTSYILAIAAEPANWGKVSTKVDGRKVKKISVLFERYEKNNSVANLSLENNLLKKENELLKERLLLIEERLNDLEED